jgi:hypothetical protein
MLPDGCTSLQSYPISLKYAVICNSPTEHDIKNHCTGAALHRSSPALDTAVVMLVHSAKVVVVNQCNVMIASTVNIAMILSLLVLLTRVLLVM